MSGHEAAVRQVVWFHVLDFGFCLSCACRIMDIHDEFSFMYDDIIETLACRKFLGSNDIIPHYTACFTDTGSSSAGFALTIPITWKVLMEELHEEFDLAAEFEVGLEDGLGVGDVDAIHLGGIDLSFTFMDCRMKADCGEFLREFSFIRAAFAEVEEALVAEFHIVDVADADDTFIFVYAVYCKLKRYRLHKTVFASFFDVRSRQE